MDWGEKVNLIEYGQTTPPPYNLTTVTAPVILFWGENDWLATPKVCFLVCEKSWLPTLSETVQFSERIN